MKRRPLWLFLIAAGLGLTPAGRVPAQTVTHISAGYAHSLFSKSDGSLWAMGDNTYGELGIGFAPGMTNVPQEVVSNGVGLVAAGLVHSLFQEGHAVWAMGFNFDGEL